MARPRLWNDDENAKLMQLEAKNVPRDEIAQRLRKTREQVAAQICRLRARQGCPSDGATIGRKRDPCAPWTSDEIGLVLKLGRDARGMADWGAIASAHFPGRTATACKQQYFHRRAAIKSSITLPGL